RRGYRAQPTPVNEMEDRIEPGRVGPMAVGRPSEPRGQSRPARGSMQTPLPGCRSAQRPEVLLQAVPRLRGALGHARVQHAVAVLDVVESRDGGEPGLPALVLERHGVDGHVSRHALELERPGDALRPDDLAELAVETELRA